MWSRRGMRYAVMWVGLAIGAGALAGCDGGGEADPTSAPAVTTTATAAPSPSPTPTQLATAVPMPVMPPEMANNDAEGAEAAARFFVDVYSYTYLSRDTAPFVAISDKNCVFCNSVVEEVGTMVETGETQAGGIVSVSAITQQSYHENTDVHVVDMETAQAPYREIGPTGELLAENDGGQISISVIVQKQPAGWVVLEAGPSE